MKYQILAPIRRMVGRWQTARATAHLDKRLLEDAGLKVEISPLDEISIARRSYWTGRLNK